MRDKLSGWDLLTWRLGFEDKGIVPLVGSQITVEGHVDFLTILEIIQRAVDEHDVLRLALTKEEFPTLQTLTHFELRDCVQVLHNHVNPAQAALRMATNEFSMNHYRADVPLWRLFVVHNENETLLFPFLHHAIADGRTALELVLRLCSESSTIEVTPGHSNGYAIKAILDDIFKSPVSIFEKVAPALFNLNSLVALSPRHTLPNFTKRSFRDEVVQFSVPREVLRDKAHALSLSIHDMSVALTLRIIQTLEHNMQVPESNSIRVNVPVATKQMDSLNRLLIARLFIEGHDFEDIAVNYRTHFQNWKSQPSLIVYSTALEAVSKVSQIDLTSFATTSDVTVSSLPKVSKSLSLAGHEVLSLWPLVPSMGSAFNVTSIGLNDDQYYTLSYDVATRVDHVILRKTIREVLEKNIGVVPNFQQTV